MMSLRLIESSVFGAPLESLAAAGDTHFNREFGGKPWPQWSGGRLLAVETLQDSIPDIYEFDARGQQVFKRTFAIPGARMIQLAAFARGADGSFVASGSAYSPDSRAGAFLWWTSPDAQRQALLRTSPFSAYRLTIASDGTIWTAGWEMVEGRETPNYDVIRRFDHKGRLLGSLLARSTLKTYPEKKTPAATSYLFSSKDRVGWYSDSARQYFEFSLDGKVSARFNGLAFGSTAMKIDGVALCDGGAVFAGVTLLDQKGPKAWQIFSLDRVTGEWQPVRSNVNPSAIPPKTGYVLGCEGRTLVTTNGLPVLKRFQVSE